MLQWIADYEVLRPFEDPARRGTRVDATPPARLGLDGEVVIEVVDGDPARSGAWLGRWAAAAEGVATLARPLELGAFEGPGRVWVARLLGPRTGTGTLAAAAAAAEALAALHGAGLVHGAVGPGRIVATPHGGVLDLPPLEPGASAEVVVAPSADAIDTVAPELLRGEAPTAASDVWSLGACVLRAVSGAPVHPGIGDDVLLAAVGRVCTQRPSAAPAGSALAPIVAACLAADPADRPRIADVAAELALHVGASA